MLSNDEACEIAWMVKHGYNQIPDYHTFRRENDGYTCTEMEYKAVINRLGLEYCLYCGSNDEWLPDSGICMHCED